MSRNIYERLIMEAMRKALRLVAEEDWGEEGEPEGEERIGADWLEETEGESEVAAVPAEREIGVVEDALRQLEDLKGSVGVTKRDFVRALRPVAEAFDKGEISREDVKRFLESVADIFEARIQEEEEDEFWTETEEGEEDWEGLLDRYEELKKALGDDLEDADVGDVYEERRERAHRIVEEALAGREEEDTFSTLVAALHYVENFIKDEDKKDEWCELVRAVVEGREELEEEEEEYLAAEEEEIGEEEIGEEEEEAPAGLFRCGDVERMLVKAIVEALRKKAEGR